jgi:hypothetical protein
MNIIQTVQTYIQTIWASILVLGWVKIAIGVVIIGVLTRVEKILGLVAAILFIAYLLHWI